MSSDVSVIDAAPAHLPGVAAVYTHYVLKTTVTFNTSVRTPAQWLERYEQDVKGGPYELLVAVDGDAVLGYVQTSRFRPHEAYSRSLETSIYVAPGAEGHGVGGALYGELFRRLEGTEFHRAFAIIALPNESSVAFHERFGFVHRGTLTQAGNKFDRWLDVGYWERNLSGGTGE